MTRTTPKALALVVAVAVSGCSTSPTITMPNPLAALNGVFTAPAAPGYTTQVAVPASAPTYIVDQPSVVGSSYGVTAPTYAVAAPTYSVGSPVGASAYSTVPTTIDSTSYSLGPAQTFPSPAIQQYSTQLPAQTISYGQNLPVQASAVSQQSFPTFGTVQSVPSIQTIAPSQIVEPVSVGRSFQTIPTTGSSLDGVVTYQANPVLSAPVTLPGGATLTY